MSVPPVTPTLHGDRVVLRPVRPEDTEARARHGFHADIERNYGRVTASRAMTRDEAQAWLDAAARSAPGCLWAIDVADELVGFADLHRVDLDNRRASYAIGMLAPRFVGRGWGRESTTLVLQHAFDGLGLHRVDLRVLAFNRAAIRSYEACGFVVEGRERDSCWMDGAWHDDVMMSLLEHEFRARRTARPDV